MLQSGEQNRRQRAESEVCELQADEVRQLHHQGGQPCELTAFRYLAYPTSAVVSGSQNTPRPISQTPNTRASYLLLLCKAPDMVPSHIVR